MNIQMRLPKLSITLDEAARKVKNDGHVVKPFSNLFLSDRTRGVNSVFRLEYTRTRLMLYLNAMLYNCPKGRHS